jgi:Uma2 family endonuclease
MSIETLISVEEYLNTAYDPDVEYVDGVLEERNVGDRVHSLVQRNVIVSLCRKYLNVKVWPELRSGVSPTRFRLPDVCVTLKDPRTKVLLEAAFLVIEILSEDDRMSGVMERLRDFETKGVAHIWLIDPRLRTLSVYRSGNLEKVPGDLLATEDPRLELTRAEIFEDLDA